LNISGLLNPTRCDHDTTGRTKYMKVCTEMGINPVSFFIKNLEQKELKMRFHGLGPLGIKAISIPLEVSEYFFFSFPNANFYHLSKFQTSVKIFAII